MVAAIERHLDDALVLNHLAAARVNGVQLDGVRCNLDLLGNRTHLYGEVDFSLLADRPSDARPIDQLESQGLHLDPVPARQ